MSVSHQQFAIQTTALSDSETKMCVKDLSLNGTFISVEGGDYKRAASARGGKLDVKLLQAARQEDMEFVKERQIYEYTSVKDCLARAGRPPVGTKWMETNNGDDQSPQYRPHLVATEVRRPWSEKWFAATPPLGTLRLLVALAARGSRKTGKAQRTLLLDVSRALWYPDATREVYV